MKIGIIGGGISGVSLLVKLSLLKKGGADISATLLEADDKLGGTIQSVHKDGYTIEGGTNGFLDSKPFTLEVFKEAGLQNKLVRSNDKARKRYIQRGGKLQKLPAGAMSFLTSDLLSFSGKIRLMGEYFVPQKTDGEDETLGAFARRRLGEEALDYLIAPMVSGIFAGDPDKMSLRSCFPVIANLEAEYGGLIKGMLKKRNKKGSAAGPGGVLTAYEGGMGEAVKDLADVAIKNGAEIIKNAKVTEIIKNGDGYIVKAGDKSYEFDKLAICAPSYEVSAMVKNLDAELSKALSKIKYAPIFACGVGFNDSDIKDDLDGFGYLIPAKEGRDILGALFTSSMFPAQAPDGKKFLRILAGGDRHHELMKKTDAELLDICIRDVTDILGVSKSPYMVQTFRYEKAIPQYYAGHSEIVKKVEERADKLGNLYIGGNILYGIGLNDCTKTSKMIFEKIKADVK